MDILKLIESLLMEMGSKYWPEFGFELDCCIHMLRTFTQVTI